MSPDGLTIGIEKTNVDMKPCTSMRRLLEIARTGEIPTLTQSSPPTIFLAILAAANDHSRDTSRARKFRGSFKALDPVLCDAFADISKSKDSADLIRFSVPKLLFQFRYYEDEDD